MTVRVRFAPSPTGELHLGGARTALYNWVFARQHPGGVFILRIEDTDKQRSDPKFTEGILEGLRWLGLDWDEGPIRQSEREARYHAYAEQLIAGGRAYRCWASSEEVEAEKKRLGDRNQTPAMNAFFRGRTEPRPGVAPAVRFRAREDGTTRFADLVKGELAVNNEELDDLVIIKSDGSPTYNFAVVCDDQDMRITHVIRGDDHVSNTPRQIQIIQAFGWEQPRYAHLPMILGPDKQKLSKRHGATSTIAYRDQGFLPEAIFNGLLKLGWGLADQEVISREEAIRSFDLSKVNAGHAVFDIEKLKWMNGVYLRGLPVDSLAGRLAPFFEARGWQADPAQRARIAATLQERGATLVEMAGNAEVYFRELESWDPKADEKFLLSDLLPAFRRVREVFGGLEDWRAATIEAAFQGVLAETGLKLGKLAQPVRVAVTGGAVSPPIFDVLEILGKETVLNRLAQAIVHIEAKE